jgi:hypothetical protein
LAASAKSEAASVGGLFQPPPRRAALIRPLDALPACKREANSTTPKHTGYVRGLYWLEGSEPHIANRIETIVMGPIDHNAAIAHQFILNDQITSLSKSARNKQGIFWR